MHSASFNCQTSKLHDEDMWLMLDVVGNHMGNQPGSRSDFSMFTPFNDAVQQML